MVEQNLVFISCCCSNKNIFLPEKFKALQNQLNISIEESKEKYYTKLSSRLADPVASPKKGNNYRKENNQSLKNYRPISLLPICSKSFDRLIYNEIFTFFTENNLISPNQSGFRPGNSCINQLLTITHEIYKSSDEGFEVRGVFLDMSKAFNKVWYEGLVLKLNQNGISGNLLKVLRDFFSCRKEQIEQF